MKTPPGEGDEGLGHQRDPLTLVLENAPVILYGLDLDGRFVFSMGNGMVAMGLKTGQLVGESALELYRGVPGAEAAIRSALAGEHAVFRAHFGGAHFVSRLTPVSDAAGVVERVVGVSVDTGAQMRAEMALDKRSDQERQSQKMEAAGQLAGGIAHDFNNLLTAIMGYCELLLEGDHRSVESMRGDLEQIKRAAERAAGLTRQILAFSRLQPLQPETMSLNKALKESEVLLRRVLGEDIDLQYELSSELGLIDADPNQLDEVVMNLAINARDAMRGGGTLRLETSNVELDGEFCWTNPECMPGAYVLLRVSDSGEGMDAGTVSRIFEPFFTTKEVGEGTGLGLSTVYGIVRQSGGFILTDSEVGVGTAFRIYFPRVEDPGERPVTAAEPLSLATAQATVLVVEDEPALRVLITQVLTSAGYAVLAAMDASQALKLLKVSDRRCDLLLTDIVLPRGLQGDALAREALVSRPGLPVLFMSGYPRDALMDSGVLDSGIDYLSKPFGPGALLRRVRAALGGLDG